jgi:hypothetical protein
MAISLTRNEICRDALEDLGEIPFGQDMSANQLTKAARKLQMLLASDQAVHKFLTQRVNRTISLTNGDGDYGLQAECITPENFTISVDNNDLPLILMNKEDYDSYQTKTGTGQPKYVYIDYQYDGAVAYFLPIPGQAYTVKYTSYEEFATLAADDVLPIRALWYTYLCHRLAAMCALTFNREEKLPFLTALAKQAKDEASAFDMETKVLRIKAGTGVV